MPFSYTKFQNQRPKNHFRVAYICSWLK